MITCANFNEVWSVILLCIPFILITWLWIIWTHGFLNFIIPIMAGMVATGLTNIALLHNFLLLPLPILHHPQESLSIKGSHSQIKRIFNKWQGCFYCSSRVLNYFCKCACYYFICKRETWREFRCGKKYEGRGKF